MSTLIGLITALVLLVLAAPAAAAVSAGNTGWRWSNPQPQGNSLYSTDFVGARGYAAGAAGTLLRSDDQGASWSSVRSGLTADITRLKATTADSFVFTTGCALRRSDDGGATVTRLPWTSNDLACANNIRSFAFPTADAGYLLLDNGAVYATGDKGQSWALATSLPGTGSVGGSADPGDIHFTSATEGVATADGQIYRTINSGSSWTLVGTTGGELRRFSFTSALDGYVAGSNGKPLMTADGGATWTPVGGDPGAELYDFDCATTLVCIGRSKDGLSIKQSTDGGLTWGSIAPTSFGVYGVAFASAKRAIGVGGSGAIVVSNDAGATWTSVSTSVEGSFNRMRVRSQNVAYVFGLGGALARTLDGGASWQRFNVLTTGDVIDVAFPDPAEGYALDSNGQLLKTKNGGTSWQVLDTGTTAHPSALWAPNAKTVALVGPRGVRLSSDSGTNFKLISKRALKRAALAAVDEARGAVFVFGSRSIYRSDDKGNRWVAVRGPRKRKIWTLDFVTSRVGYVLDGDGEVWQTASGGRRWKLLTGFGHNDRSGGPLSRMAWGDAKTGYVTGPGQPIIATSDGGKTWVEQTAFASDNSYDPILVGSGGGKNAFALRSLTSSIIVTNSGGRAGAASKLKLKPTKRKVRRGTNLKVGGSLAGAVGGEIVRVGARAVGAKPGTAWKYQDVVVSSTGTFTSVWRVKKKMIFVAWWSGDAARDADGADPVTVRLR